MMYFENNCRTHSTLLIDQTTVIDLLEFHPYQQLTKLSNVANSVREKKLKDNSILLALRKLNRIFHSARVANRCFGSCLLSATRKYREKKNATVPMLKMFFLFLWFEIKWWSKQKLKCESHCSKFKHGKADFMSLSWHEWLFYHLEAFAHFIIHTFFLLVFCRRKFWQKFPVLLSIQHLKCEMDEIRCNWNTFDLQILVVHWIHLTPARPASAFPHMTQSIFSGLTFPHSSALTMPTKCENVHIKFSMY